MKPLEILANEHGVMRQFLDNLDLAVEKLKKDERPPKEFFENAVQFAKTFANELHHFKEEQVMFVRLAQKQNGTMDGQIESLRQQHDRGRNYISEISNALDGYGEGHPAQVSQVLNNTVAYTSMLRDHIQHEDHVFFPMVLKELSEEEGQQLQVEFEKARQKAGEDSFEKGHKLVVDMGSMLAHMK